MPTAGRNIVQNRPEPASFAASYTIDTLISLRNELGADVALCLLMGRDAFLGLPSWHRWQELIQHCHIVVAHRPDADTYINALLDPSCMPAALRSLWETHAAKDIEDLNNAVAGRILTVAITALDISATRIRQAFSSQRSCRYLMPAAVIDYIEQHGLYLV